MVTDRIAWAVLWYRVPRTPSAPRIAVWRRLRRLGVAQIGDGLVALPEDARTREQLEWVAQEVEDAGGESVLWRAWTLSAGDERRLVAGMVRLREAEYAELIRRAQAAAASEAGARGRALASLRRQLREIRRRDFFPAQEYEAARAAVEALAGRDVPAPAAAVRSS